jgi:hypothetical protein
MDSLKFHLGYSLLRPVGGPPLKQPNNRFRALGHPTPYAYDLNHKFEGPKGTFSNSQSTCAVHQCSGVAKLRGQHCLSQCCVCGNTAKQTLFHISGPESDGDRGHSCEGAQGPEGGLERVPTGRKEAAQERAVKAKEGAVCVFEKGRKEEKRIKVKGFLGPFVTPRDQKRGPTQSQEA